MRGDGATRVQRTVDRVDDDLRRPPLAEPNLAPLLRDGDERGAGVGEPLELAEDDVLAAAVDRQGPVPALAHPLVDGSLIDLRRLLEDLPLRGDDASADPPPVCRKDVHLQDATSR